MSQVEAVTGAASEERVEFDEADENGLLIADKYLPEELMSEILFNVDHKTSLNCQLVCKRWYSILQNYVWRKKAEATVGKPLHFDKGTPWYLYYFICAKQLLEKNLIINHSGEHGKDKYWRIMQNGGHKWRVECPPHGVPPLPTDSDPVFEGKQQCFVTSFGDCVKQQTVNLIAKGFPPQFLDTIQPPITVSEWYSCRWDCPAIYQCVVELIGVNGKVLDDFHFEEILEGAKQNMWHHVKHEFTNYGPGLRKVRFHHQGKDRSFWAGHYGSKMAGACVRVNLPKQIQTEDRKKSDTLLNSE